MNVFIEIRLVVAPPLYLSRPCPACALLCTSHQLNLNPQEEVTSLLGIFNRSFISQQLFRDANANSYANIIFSQKCEYWIMFLYYYIFDMNVSCWMTLQDVKPYKCFNPCSSLITVASQIPPQLTDYLLRHQTLFTPVLGFLWCLVWTFVTIS